MTDERTPIPAPPVQLYRLRVDLATGETKEIKVLNASYSHTLARELYLRKDRGMVYVLVQETGEKALSLEAYVGYFRFVTVNPYKLRLVQFYLKKDARDVARPLWKELSEWMPGGLSVAEELEPAVKELIG